MGDEERLTLIDNYVIEIADGYGMIVDSSTCRMELNQLKKNGLGGLLMITSKRLNMPKNFGRYGNDSGQGRNLSTANMTPDGTVKVDQKKAATLDQLRTFSTITIDNCLATHNLKFGVGVFAYYGTLTIKNSQFSENEEYGIVLSKSVGHANNMLTTESNSSEIFLDYEVTDQVIRTPMGPQRSQRNNTVSRADHAMMDPPASHADDWNNMAAFVQDSTLERPLEIVANQCLVYRCEIQSNRIDGIKSVDYSLNVLGCLIASNCNNAIKVVHPSVAETNIYFKNKQASDTDL